MNEQTNKDRLDLVSFSSINLNDPFFDSLKEDYKGFSDWFNRKAEKSETAFVLMDEGGYIQAFLYTKIEEGIVEDVSPILPSAKRLKVGTFKVDAHNTKLGERYIKRIADVAITERVKEIYLTIFPKHEALIKMLKKYGFIQKGQKGDELVLVKSLVDTTGDLLKDYPLIPIRGNKKYSLAIYPEFHTCMFPDSILHNERKERYELIKDVSHTNSIHKIYVSYMIGLDNLKPGDLLAIYRTSDGKGNAEYRSVVTSICRVEEVKTRNDFSSVEEYIGYANAYSIFDEKDLAKLFDKRNLVIIKMTYNAALTRRVIRKDLIEKVGISRDAYAGFIELTDNQFEKILKLGNVDEYIVVNKA